MTQSKSFSRASLSALIALASALSLAACAKPGTSNNVGALADSASGTVGCESFESEFFDSLYKFPLANEKFPTEQAMREAFAKSVPASRLAKLTDAQQAQVSEELTNLYSLLTQDALTKLGQENATSQAQLATLAALEIGDSSTPEKEAVQAQIKSEMTKLEVLTSGTQSTCSKAPAPSLAPVDASSGASGSASLDDVSTGASSPKTLFSQWKASRPRVVYGALKTLATAYQSCEAGVTPALNDRVPDVAGITVVGRMSDGIGLKRLITNINDLYKTHPYLHDYQKPQASCYDVRKNMPIYDYGGRPSTSTGAFNLFQSSGSGTAALGTDCGGYVYMSIATGGLRVKKAKDIKAVGVVGISSSMFTNPQKNGLTCFDYVTFKGATTLKSGDIIAKNGHVIIVQTVGNDPWGLSNLTSIDQCKISNMSTSRFNFTILQDSPWKSGLGIQSSQVADWLPSESVMPDGLLEAAVTACKAKFGTAGTAKNDKIAVIRHAGTPECMNPAEIQMTNQSCVASCPASPTITRELASDSL